MGFWLWPPQPNEKIMILHSSPDNSNTFHNVVLILNYITAAKYLTWFKGLFLTYKLILAILYRNSDQNPVRLKHGATYERPPITQ